MILRPAHLLAWPRKKFPKLLLQRAFSLCPVGATSQPSAATSVRLDLTGGTCEAPPPSASRTPGGASPFGTAPSNLNFFRNYFLTGDLFRCRRGTSGYRSGRK